MVDKVGVEPTTSRVSDVCTNQLCYLSIWLSGNDSNVRMTVSKTAVLPLHHPTRRVRKVGLAPTASLYVYPIKNGGGGGSRTHYLLGMSQSCKLLHFTAMFTPFGGNLI